MQDRFLKKEHGILRATGYREGTDPTLDLNCEKNKKSPYLEGHRVLRESQISVKAGQ